MTTEPTNRVEAMKEARARWEAAAFRRPLAEANTASGLPVKPLYTPEDLGDFDYLGRNANNGYFWVTWDGETQSGNKVTTVPNGDYTIRLTVLKALGDPSDPAHSETWTSPTITIARP